MNNVRQHQEETVGVSSVVGSLRRAISYLSPVRLNHAEEEML